MSEQNYLEALEAELLNLLPDERLVPIDELQKKGIVGKDRSNFYRLVQNHGFPPGVLIGGRRMGVPALIRAYILDCARRGETPVIAAATSGPKPHSPRVSAMIAGRGK